MAKRLVSIKVDEEVLREAKEIGLNISKVCENALKEAVVRLRGMYGGNGDSYETAGFPSQRFFEVEKGRLAQMDRALASGARGRGFEPRIAHQN